VSGQGATCVQEVWCVLSSGYILCCGDTSDLIKSDGIAWKVPFQARKVTNKEGRERLLSLNSYEMAHFNSWLRLS
jgi:hypothetical protein